LRYNSDSGLLFGGIYMPRSRKSKVTEEGDIDPHSFEKELTENQKLEEAAIRKIILRAKKAGNLGPTSPHINGIALTDADRRKLTAKKIQMTKMASMELEDEPGIDSWS
jgi:hypothetical protein